MAQIHHPCSCLENPRDRAAWWTSVYGVAQSRTRLTRLSSSSSSSSFHVLLIVGFPGGSDDNETACNVGEPGSIPGLGRSPGDVNGNPLQYSCLDNPMDGGAWQSTVYGVAKSRAQLSDFTITAYLLIKCYFFFLKESQVRDFKCFDSSPQP